MLSLRKRLGLDRPYFLVVGRVELRKNTAGVLKAFGLLQASDLPPHLLVLAGPRDADTYDPDHVLPPQGRHGDVLVTGYLPDEELAALLPAPPSGGEQRQWRRVAGTQFGPSAECSGGCGTGARAAVRVTWGLSLGLRACA